MAKPIWITLPVASGSGNATVVVNALKNTGRNQRRGILTVEGYNVTPVKTIEVTQAGAAEYINRDQEEYAVAISGQTINITGTSNSKYLFYEILSSDIEGLEISDTYTAAGAAAENGIEIPNDPGANEAYIFSIPVVIPPNETIESKTVVIQISAFDEQKFVKVNIKQTAAEPEISVSLTSLSFSAEGGSQEFSIESNTGWTIS